MRRKNQALQKNLKIIEISTYFPITTLNINGLNSPGKKQSLAAWIKKDPTICCL
jgi:hypothetical protein